MNIFIILSICWALGNFALILRFFIKNEFTQHLLFGLGGGSFIGGIAALLVGLTL